MEKIDEVYTRRQSSANPDDDASEDEDEGEGEDLMENMDADYQRIGELDTYDATMLDDRQYAGMTLEARKRAEEENARRAAR